MENKEMNQELFDFIEASPTMFHMVDTMSKALKEEGFEELDERKPWTVKNGGNYYVTRNHSSLIAFRVGKSSHNCKFHIVAAHTDSPCFKIKENAELHTAERYCRLNTEGYGGMLCSTWLDKALGIAGRVVYRDSAGKLVEKLIDFKEDTVLIPNLAIHMNREANDGYKWNKQVDLLPLLGGNTEEGAFRKKIAQELSKERGLSDAIRAEDILGSDLFLYNRQKPIQWGADKEFISAPRLDDSQCAFAGFKALLSASNPEEGVSVFACFDNEEVGSTTKQGACSTFLADSLKRLLNACLVAEGMDAGDDKNVSLPIGQMSSYKVFEEAYYCALANSFMISADNAHAVHPNHPEHTDATNCVYMNGGIVLKSHAGQKYTSDAVSMAYLKDLAQRNDVKVQYFANRSDKAGGSTLGNLSQTQVSVNTVDLGLAQLAMHSSYETAGANDTMELVKLLEGFYRE